MATNRKAAEAYILKTIAKLLPGKANVELYTKKFAEMSDVDFGKMMHDIKNGDADLVLRVEQFQTAKLSMENNIKVAEEMGHSFFKRLWIGPDGDTPKYLTPVKYMVIDMPLRRASQLLTKKISIPENNKTVDSLTGQPAGASKGAKISFDELQICAGMNMDSSMIEMMKYRGGDLGGFRALSAMIARTGSANLATLANYASGVESTKTVKTILTGMHLKSTL